MWRDVDWSRRDTRSTAVFSHVPTRLHTASARLRSGSGQSAACG